MILSPLDSELPWAQVEANYADAPAIAEQTWAAAGILMPDDAAEELKLTLIETLLTQTATALNMPLREIYPARNRIRWMTCFNDGPILSTWASLDGGPPSQINQP
jgi:hypothetical protein